MAVIGTDFKISRNKTFEVEIGCEKPVCFLLSFKLNFREDHAGLYIMFNFFTFFTYISIYDNRHWDYEKNEWCTYEK